VNPNVRRKERVRGCDAQVDRNALRYFVAKRRYGGSALLGFDPVPDAKVLKFSPLPAAPKRMIAGRLERPRFT
jgi:SRSO17 transposase